MIVQLFLNLPQRCVSKLSAYKTRIGACFLCATAAFAFFTPEPVLAGGIAQRAARSAARRAIRLRALKPAQILRRDLLNHRVTVPRPLLRSRTVHRFTALKRARIELRRGLAPNSHMTAMARPGRPMSSLRATRRFGLLRAPQVRETIQLPKGFLVRHNHAVGAGRGVRELTSPLRVPPKAIVDIRKLR